MRIMRITLLVSSTNLHSIMIYAYDYKALTNYKWLVFLLSNYKRVISKVASGHCKYFCQIKYL